MQIAICILIIFGTSYIGIGLSRYYIKRERLFFELTMFCEKLKSDIGFLLMPLVDILKSVERDYSSLLVDISIKVLKKIDQGEIINTDNMYEMLECVYLKDEERSLIGSFFSVLGKSDSRSQLQSIEGFAVRFSELEKKCEKERERLSPMCTKLGIISGLAICLLVI